MSEFTNRARTLRHFTLVFLALTVAVDTGRAAEPKRESVRKSLVDYMDRAEAFGFSGALLVERDRQIILNEGYGLADRVKGTPVRSDTVFSVASITKPVTATAILLLQDEGKLNVKDRIADCLPGVPPDKATITIHQLMTHTAGLIGEQGVDLKATREEALRVMLASPLLYPPGQKWSYSNLGYALLAMIVELKSTKPYEQFVVERIFQPAQMKTAGFQGDPSRWPEQLVAHTYNRNTDFGSPAGWPNYGRGRGAGNMIASTSDLLAFWHALNDGRLIAPGTIPLAIRPHVEVKADRAYGYGWWTFKTKYGPMIYHGGNKSPLGVTAELRHYVDSDVTTALLVNAMRDEVGYNRAVRDVIEAVIFGDKFEMPPTFVSVDGDTLEKFEGKYAVNAGAAVRVRRYRDGLILSADGQSAIDMVMVHDEELRTRLRTRNELAVKAVEDGCKKGPTVSRPEEWDESFDVPGPCESVTPIGTVSSPDDSGELISFVRIRTSGGDRIARLIWFDGDDYFLFDGAPEPDLFHLMPISASEFVGFDLFNHSRIGVRFSCTPKGQTITLNRRSHEDIFSRIN